MTTILVEGKPIAIKEGSTFEYVVENRDFTDADGYTLSIDVPLRGCRQNLEVFGMMDRQDFSSREKILRCELRAGAIVKHGALTVVGYDSGILKCQFLEGRSLQNFEDTLENVYVSELTFPYPPTMVGVSPTAHYQSYDEGAKWVALPWMYEAEGVLQNPVKYRDGEIVWETDDPLMLLPATLSYQPYLIWVAKWVCDAIGYSYDFSQWEQSTDRFILVCNTLPVSFGLNSFSKALPRWSVPEFFKQVELILCGEIEFDHYRKKVMFTYTANAGGRDELVMLENVVDDFSGEVEYEEEKTEYKALKNISYDGDDTAEWKIAQCQWLIDFMREIPDGIVEVESENDFLEIQILHMPWWTSRDRERGKNMGVMYHIKETDRYVIFQVVHTNFNTNPDECSVSPEEVNRYHPVISQIEGADETLIKIIPLSTIVVDDNGQSVIWLKPQAAQEFEDYDDEGIRQPYAMSILNNGKSEKPEYYTKIYVGFWKGLSDSDKQSLMLPCPRVLPFGDNTESLAIRDRYGAFVNRPAISVREKRSFKFMAEEIPNVRSIFVISGKRYLCEKITATFTQDGMSRLMKGEFYPIRDQRAPS